MTTEPVNIRRLANSLPQPLKQISISQLDDDEIKDVTEWYDQQRKPLADILSDLRLAEDNKDNAKARGAVFTPYWLAERLVANVRRHWNRLHRNGRQPKMVADVSCGVGVFLLASERYFSHGTKFVGQDIDPVSIEYTRLLQYVSEAEWHLQCCDSLLLSRKLTSLWDRKDQAPIDLTDILIGNPPYVRCQLLDKDYARLLRDRYDTLTSGNPDLSVAFLEHAIDNLAEGGIASYIVSNKFMSARYGRTVRRLLEAKTRILNIEDFQDLQLFRGYTTYTCILTFAKKTKAKRFTITRFPTSSLSYSDPGNGQMSTLPTDCLSLGTWDFAVGPIHEVLSLLRNPENPMLVDVVGPIFQGIRTGANSVFVLNQTNAGKVESSLLRPFVGGEQISRFRYDKEELRLLYPYTEDAMGSIRSLTHNELSSNYPKSWKYLESHRKELEERASEPHGVWYCYSRSQNLDLLSKQKILVREMMPRVEFAADEEGCVMFSSGYAIDASRLGKEETRLWVAVLCTPTMEFILRHNSTQLHSGWFRLLKHYLGRTRLPLLKAKSRIRAVGLAEKLHGDPNNEDALYELDSLVAQAFNLKSKHRQIIQDHLCDCHKRSCPSRMNPEYVAAESTEPSNTGSIPKINYEPVKLAKYNKYHRERFDLNKYVTFVPNKLIPIHRWYPFTQGFSEPLVEYLVRELGISAKDTVLDPFGGCGTTALTCRRFGISSVSVDISPFVSWVAKVKTRHWNSNALQKHADAIMSDMKKLKFRKHFEPCVFEDFLRKAYSDHILKQIHSFISLIRANNEIEGSADFFFLGLVSIMEEVSQIRKHGSHYRYMLSSENVGLQKLNTEIIHPNANILPVLAAKIESMVDDTRRYRFHKPMCEVKVLVGDAKKLILADRSVSVVITSPPYLNRNNYLSQQKAELAMLGFVKTYDEYKRLVRSTFRSHVEAGLGGAPQTGFDEVRAILNAMKLTKNNNPKIPHMIAGYFEDLDATLHELGRVVRRHGTVVFVVGNTRWGGIVVPVDHMLAKIAEKNGFVVNRILVTRYKGNSPQQMAKYGRIPVRESVVVLENT